MENIQEDIPLNTLPSTFKLTQDHINEGVADECLYCPMALAINNAYKQSLPYPQFKAEVHEEYTIILNTSQEDDHTEPKKYKHCTEITSWITAFDQAAYHKLFDEPYEIPKPMTLKFNHIDRTITKQR